MSNDEQCSQHTTRSSDNSENTLESPSNRRDDDDNSSNVTSEAHSPSPNTEEPVKAPLRELLTAEKAKNEQTYFFGKGQRRQVVFSLVNLIVLFVSMIVVMPELQARAPVWLKNLEQHSGHVRNCAASKEALFRCVERVEFSGFVTSTTNWLTRSATTRRLLLFGFESPQKLWSVVYESCKSSWCLVWLPSRVMVSQPIPVFTVLSAVCWGISYILIRRGMNPDTRANFIQKYWKDAVFGSLAGFNASFLKHVLKNFIPQEAVEDVLLERRFLRWLPSFEIE